MSSAINEIDIEFKEIKNVNIETIGSYTVTLFSYVYLVVLCIVSSVDKLYGFLP
jgi:hypothetical protein